MTAQGETRRVDQLPIGGLILGLLAVVAAALSLSVFLLAARAHEGRSNGVVALSAAEELALRNQRIAFFEARLQNDPIDIVILDQLAGQYLQRARETGDVGDYQRAETAATRSLAIVPGDNLGALSSLASVRLVQHGFAEALSLSERIIALRPDEGAGYALQGDALVGLGRYEEAGRAYQKLVLIQPDLTTLSRLATLAFINGDSFNAEDLWHQALRDTDGLPVENVAWARVQLGSVYFAKGDLDRAMREYESASKLYPGYVHATAGIASLRAAQGRYDEAIALYQETIARLPQMPNIVALVDVETKAGRLEDAKNTTQLVGAIDKLYQASGINTDLQLAIFYADHGRAADAISLAENAYESSPGVYAADALAWALYRNGQFEEARARSDEAMRLGTPEALFWYHSGMIRLALGETAGAKSRLETALRLNPHFSVVFGDEAASTLQGLER